MLRIVGLGAGALTAAAAATAAAGAMLWSRATSRAHTRLGPPAVRGPETFSEGQLVELPSPVARYFRFALAPGQPIVRRATIRTAGDFLARPGGRWSPFTAVQHFAADPPGFVWDARIRMAPLVAIHVRDGYVRGEGSMLGRIWGVWPVVDQRGTPELAAGALLRYLAECVWLPTALLPREGLSWAGIDDATARATLTDGATTVALDVHFAPGGEITRVSAMRHRDVSGVGVLTPWTGRFSDYTRVKGMMVPMSGEVEWLLPDGPTPYWRGRIVRTAYEPARTRDR
ncbi:MAG: DUF6544 family protein [Gemmatimonadales bacterium]